MTDPRVTRMAQILLQHSVAIKPEDALLVWGYSELAKPLLLEVCREAIRRGAGPIITQVDYREIQEALLESGSDELLRSSRDLLKSLVERLDVSIRILAPPGREGVEFDPHRAALLEMAHGGLRTALHRRTRMVVTFFPTEAAARDAGMSSAAFEDYVFGAIDQDWAKIGSEQRSLIDSVLGSAKEITIRAPGTELVLSVRGRSFVNCDGRINMPDGEIFTSPVEDSAQGHILFSYPAISPSGGRRVEGIHLWFEDGRVVKAVARDGGGHLEAMLGMDPGARYLGEFGIGNNFRLDRWIGDILFDEKMGGTIHLALGQGFPEAGGVNESSLHWDLITDLKLGGEIFVDGTLVQKDGHWVC